MHIQRVVSDDNNQRSYQDTVENEAKARRATA